MPVVNSNTCLPNSKAHSTTACYEFPVLRVAAPALAAEDNSAFLPSDAVRNPILIGYCTRVGFTPIYKGVRAAEGVARLAKECCRRAGLRTFILAGDFHATALAIRGNDVAVFDAAEGIGIFRQRTAKDDELMTTWFRVCQEKACRYWRAGTDLLSTANPGWLPLRHTGIDRAPLQSPLRQTGIQDETSARRRLIRA
jgi:hypothetical protein